MKSPKHASNAVDAHELAGILLTMLQEMRETVRVSVREGMAGLHRSPSPEEPVSVSADLISAIRDVVAQEVRAALAATLHPTSGHPTSGHPTSGHPTSDHPTSESMAADDASQVAETVSHPTVMTSLTSDAPPSWEDETVPQGDYLDLIHLELTELLKRIQSTKSEVASLRPESGATDQIIMATMELEAVVQATEQATSDILESAENLQNTVSRLRSETLTLKDVPSIAEYLEDAATNILMTCSFQDLTGQRIHAALNTLLYVEQSLERIVDLWGISAGTADATLQRNRPDDKRPDKHLLHGPQMDGGGVSQGDIDRLFNE